jgi:hypothetical protein
MIVVTTGRSERSAGRHDESKTLIEARIGSPGRELSPVGVRGDYDEI